MLVEARALASTDSDRAQKIFEELTRTAHDEPRFDAELELAIIALGVGKPEEAANRVEIVLANPSIASRRASAVAAVYRWLVLDSKGDDIDDRLMEDAALLCVAVNEPYFAGVGFAASARHCAFNGVRERALRLFMRAEEQYALSPSMLGVPGVALRLAALYADAGDFRAASAALQRGLAHVAKFPYGGQNIRMLRDKLLAATADLAKRQGHREPSGAG
jgi:hypothetical protein